MQRKMIKTKILSSLTRDQGVYVPRISVITEENPFEYKSVQFQIRLLSLCLSTKQRGEQ